MTWDRVGYPGRGSRAAIAGIARDRRDRKNNPGVESAKSLFFGVELGEGGCRRDRIIGEIGNRDSTAEGGCGHTRIAKRKGSAPTLSRGIVWTAPSEPVETLSPDRTHSGL
jgi:hypothetical protein